MQYPLELTIDEITLLRQSLDLITISGKSAKLVAGMQDKCEEALFQIQMNIQIQEQERIQIEQEKQQQLEALLAKEAKKTSRTSAS
jgi:hypothetical protein